MFKGNRVDFYPTPPSASSDLRLHFLPITFRHYSFFFFEMQFYRHVHVATLQFVIYLFIYLFNLFGLNCPVALIFNS